MNLRSDHEIAIKGVLWQSRGAWLVLRQAQLLKASEAPVTLDGDVVVHRSNLAFLQAV